MLNDRLVKEFLLAFMSGSQTATCCHSLLVSVIIKFAVVMAQVRRPVPFRTRKLRPGRGDGTALERVWESSTPPHHTYRKPLGAHAPRGFPHIRYRPRPEPARAPGPPRIPMRPTPGTIPGQPRRRGRTTRRVRDRGSPTPGPPVCCADGSPPEGSQKPLGPRRDTPAGAQCVLGGNPLNTR